MSADLAVLMGGRVVGHIIKGRGSAARLRYDMRYTDDQAATPLSLAYPLRIREHDVGDWLDGLLPPSAGAATGDRPRPPSREPAPRRLVGDRDRG